MNLTKASASSKKTPRSQVPQLDEEPLARGEFGAGRWNLFHSINDLGEAEVMEYSSILVPLDGSRVAAEAVPYASTVANAFHLPLVLLRVIAPMEHEDMSQRSPNRQHENLRSQAEGYLLSFKNSLFAMGQEIEARIEEGDPAGVILKTLEGMAKPLLVLGARGRGASSDHEVTGNLGGVTEQIVLQWQGPILLIGKTSAPAHSDIAKGQERL